MLLTTTLVIELYIDDILVSPKQVTALPRDVEQIDLLASFEDVESPFELGLLCFRRFAILQGSPVLLIRLAG